MPADDGDRTPRIKGGVIKDPRDWMRTAYGPEAYRNALAKLAPEDRRLIDGTLLAGSWYPLPVWDTLHAAMMEEARTRQGHSDTEFNMRKMREGGSNTLRSIYKFMIGLMSPHGAISKALILYNRAYSEGHCEIVENRPGKAVVRYCDAPPAFRVTLTNNLPSGLMFLLEMNGAKHVDGRINRDEIVNGKLVFEVTVTYQA
jgi:hypothetical protein